MPRFPVNQKTREEPGRGAPHISREIVAATKEVLDYTEGGIADIQVAVINASTVLTDAQVRDVVPALQLQVHRDLAPACNIDADLTFVPKGAQPPANTWWLAILDDSTQAGALGFHETTTQGMPLGLAFARTAAEDGVNWTVTASHELLEMLVDPEINLTVFVQHTNTTGTLYAYEACDTCEADQFGDAINGVKVSDFVYPAWFETFRARGSTQFDFGKHVTAPVPQLLPGGYIGAFDVGSGSGWHQVTAMRHHAVQGARRVHAPPGSRRDRRAIGRDEWQRSQIRFD